MNNRSQSGVVVKPFSPIKGLTLLLLLPMVILLCGFTSFPAYGANVTYTEDMTDFPNPERGFWGPTVYRKYISIPTHSALSTEFLASVEKLFNDTRTSRRKIIPRFSYSNVDAPLAGMLAQMEQLRPVFERHYDVIAVLEAGFIGRWGEWHSSPNIKDNESRKAVLFKLLDVMPKERMVAVRYNAYKRAVFNSNIPLTKEEAFSGSNKARTGNHNDCFITNEGDAGSFRKLNSLEGLGLGIEVEKDYLSADNLYVPQDGETCQVGSASYASCARALVDMARMRWDMINSVFNSSVLSLWKSQGCYEEISRRLGYRIVLIDGVFDDDVTDGTLDATLQLKNVGFGKIYNPRKCEIVLRHKDTKTEFVLPANVDPRFWSPGLSQTVNIKVGIPKAVPHGNYSVFLSLQDPAPKLYGIPQYAIRLANKDLWDAATGYNSLNHTVKISSWVSVDYKVSPERKPVGRVFSVNAGGRSVEIRLRTAIPAETRIDVYNVSGSRVGGVVDQVLPSGEHHFTWRGVDRAGRALSAGVYYISLRTTGTLETRQLFLR